MNIPKSRKEWGVIVCVGILTGLVGDAIWDGIKQLAAANVGGFHRPHFGLGEMFQLAYFILVALVGVILGRRLSKAELVEIYADVILFWLKENCHTVCTFTTDHMAINVALPIEKASLGLQRLQKHELIVKKPLFWEYSAISASNVSPGYERLVGQETAAHKRENGLQQVIATQEQTIQTLKGTYDPMKLSASLATLPVYPDDLEVGLLTVDRAHDFLDLEGNMIFLKAHFLSAVSTGIRALTVRLVIDDDKYDLEPVQTYQDGRGERPLKNQSLTTQSQMTTWKRSRCGSNCVPTA